MIQIAEVLAIHGILIELFGGTKGVRDAAGLEAAVNRPYQTFDGQDLYPNPVDKAAAIFESLICNHPLLDGNKRTAYVLLRLVLQQSLFDIDASENDKYDFVIRSARGELSFSAIKSWIESRLIQITLHENP